MSGWAYSQNSGLGGQELPVYFGDEETGPITLWINTSVLRMSLARLANIANCLSACENAHRPERLGSVIGVQEIPTKGRADQSELRLSADGRVRVLLLEAPFDHWRSLSSTWNKRKRAINPFSHQKRNPQTYPPKTMTAPCGRN
jgi:hypothetical protein